MKIYRWAVALAILLGAGLWWWLPSGDAERVAGAPSGPPARSVAVETAPVTHGPIRHWASFTGSLQAQSQFDIAPRISGRLEELLVDLGEAVERGQLIARLDDEEVLEELAQARAELAVAQAGLAEAKAALEAAQRALHRTRELREQRVASQAELDAAATEVQAQEARLELARSQIAQREAAVRRAEIRLSYTRLRATWRGPGESRVVGERYVTEGALLQANSPVVSLLALDPLRAVVFVTESDYMRLTIGQPVQIRSDALPGEHFEGTIWRLAPLFREDSRQARVEIRVPNPQGRLKPGMFVQARVLLEERDHAQRIPLDALVERDGERVVFLLPDGAERVRRIAVQTGLRDDTQVEVLAPRLEGRVVTLGQHLLANDTAVRAVDTQPPDDHRSMR